MYYGNEAVDFTASSKIRYYSPVGDIEVDFDKSTNKYIVNMYVDGDPYTASILQRKENDATALYYLHRDYLGSILAITNNVGNIVEKRHFDAWGNILFVQDGQNNNLGKLTFLERGYTGHEHLQGVGLINMNARLYDAKLHRFLAPDNFIQDPGNPQNYNLYGYVFNNPLRFTDPSGNYAVVDDIVAALIGGLINLGVNIYQGNINGSFWDIIGKGAAAFGSGAAAGTLSLYGPAGWAAGGALVGGTNAWLSGDNITQGAIMGGITGVVGGAVGSYISSGISVAIQGINISSPVLQGTLGGALGGGFTGGVMNSGIIGIQTGSFSQAIDGFGSGFAMGFVTGSISGASSAYSQAKQNNISPWNGRSSTTPPSGSAMVDDAMIPVVKSLNAQIDKIGSDYQKSLSIEPIKLTTSSTSNNPSRVYAVYEANGEVYKFGVTDAALNRYNQSLLEAGPGAYGKYSGEMPKYQAHIREKYMRSLYYNSTGTYFMRGMKIPYPVDFNTLKPIKPNTFKN